MSETGDIWDLPAQQSGFCWELKSLIKTAGMWLCHAQKRARLFQGMAAELPLVGSADGCTWAL